MQVRLVVIDGPETGRSFTFAGADSFLVGRSPKAHLVLDPKADRYVSRAHCLIDIRPPNLIVNDLGSTNGTFVNGARVEHALIGNGDEIRVGRTRIRALVSEEDPAVRLATMPIIEAPASAPRGAAPAGGIGGSVSGARTAREGPRNRSALSVPAGEARIACWICERDLAKPGNSDRRAGEVPDAIYLCEACAGDIDPAAETFEGYAVLGVLGRGGMGIVYRAVDLATRRVCAIKRIRPDHLSDERSFRLFEREMGVQSQVRHRHLVRMLDHSCGPGRCDFAVEYMAGGDAGQLVSSVFHGPVEPRLAVSIVLQALEGLEALHEQGFVHRDLKPGNILLSRPASHGFGVAKISDCGLAKSFEEAGHSLFDLTREGEAAGSLMFMPPEQILNYRYVQPPADVYALGATLYHLLTGRFTLDVPELEARTTERAGRARNPIEALIEGRPVPIQARRPDLPAALARAVDGAVQKDLGARFKTARTFRLALLEAARAESWL